MSYVTLAPMLHQNSHIMVEDNAILKHPVTLNRAHRSIIVMVREIICIGKEKDQEEEDKSVMMEEEEINVVIKKILLHML